MKTMIFNAFGTITEGKVLEGKGGITNDERRSDQNRSSAVSRLQTLRYFACIAQRTQDVHLHGRHSRPSNAFVTK